MSEKLPKIALGTDHAGYTYKEFLKSNSRRGHEVKDFGTHSEESVDYPVPVKALHVQFLLGIVILLSCLGEAVTVKLWPLTR